MSERENIFARIKGSADAQSARPSGHGLPTVAERAAGVMPTVGDD